MASASSSSTFAGKVGLVVGGTNGIGRGLAEWLAQQGASVIIAGRSRERGQEVVEVMRAHNKAIEQGDSNGATFAFEQIDGSSLKDIKRFSEEFQRAHERLDYLVITAGIATTQGRTETPEGLDQKLSIHYYGRIATVVGLLPLLSKTAATGADVRAMSVLSAGVHSAFENYKNDPELKRSYSLKNVADAAGFYTDLALDSLARENPQITFIHAAPGFVATAWGTELNPVLRSMVRVFQVFGKSPATCAGLIGPSLYSADFKGGFQLVSENGQRAKVTSKHEEAREFVWAHTKEVFARVTPQS